MSCEVKSCLFVRNTLIITTTKKSLKTCRPVKSKSTDIYSEQFWTVFHFRRGLLWCFYQLFGLSFWRHPFTSEDPLVSKWCNAKFLQICSDEETNSLTSRMAWGRVHFQQSIISWWTIPLRCNVHLYINALYWILNTFSCTLIETSPIIMCPWARHLTQIAPEGLSL